MVSGGAASLRIFTLLSNNTVISVFWGTIGRGQSVVIIVPIIVLMELI